MHAGEIKQTGVNTKAMLIGSKQKVHNTDLNVSIAGSSVVKVNNLLNALASLLMKV